MDLKKYLKSRSEKKTGTTTGAYVNVFVLDCSRAKTLHMTLRNTGAVNALSYILYIYDNDSLDDPYTYDESEIAASTTDKISLMTANFKHAILAVKHPSAETTYSFSYNLKA